MGVCVRFRVCVCVSVWCGVWLVCVVCVYGTNLLVK